MLVNLFNSSKNQTVRRIDIEVLEVKRVNANFRVLEKAILVLEKVVSEKWE